MNPGERENFLTIKVGNYCNKIFTVSLLCTYKFANSVIPVFDNIVIVLFFKPIMAHYICVLRLDIHFNCIVPPYVVTIIIGEVIIIDNYIDAHTIMEFYFACLIYVLSPDIKMTLCKSQTRTHTHEALCTY